jgi:hypothetical protein
MCALKIAREKDLVFIFMQADTKTYIWSLMSNWKKNN